MDVEKFEQAAKNFYRSADALVNAAKSDLPQAQAVLTASSLPEGMPSREDAIELRLRHLKKHIEDLMVFYDRLQVASDLPVRYQTFLDSLKLTSLGWEELRRVLAEHVDTPVD